MMKIFGIMIRIVMWPVFVENSLDRRRNIGVTILLKDAWLEALVLLLDDIGGLEVGFGVLEALNSRVVDVALLGRVEHIPLQVFELVVEVHNKYRVDEVYERVSDISFLFIIKVNWHVEEIIVAIELSIQQLQ